MPYQRVNQCTELIALAKVAGIQAAPGVFRIITELLELQVPPEDIYALLRQMMCHHVPRKKKNDHVYGRKHDKVKGQ